MYNELDRPVSSTDIMTVTPAVLLTSLDSLSGGFTASNERLFTDHISLALSKLELASITSLALLDEKARVGEDPVRKQEHGKASVPMIPFPYTNYCTWLTLPSWRLIWCLSAVHTDMIRFPDGDTFA